jgi:nicotinate phosphoribosyltransferase
MKNIKNLALLTDFYEFTMMQGYFFNTPDKKAVFEMFFRHHPFNGGYTIFAGLEPLLDEIISLKFTEDDIRYLRRQEVFKEEFLNYLLSFRFQGDIYAVKEGTVVFPNEPLIRVEGNMMECQLIESLLLNFINFQSLIATKSARIVNMSGDGIVLEFGLRRAQGIDGALSAARSAFIGGVNATSNTLGGYIHDIPVSGTMAHSWVMAFESELESFEKYAELYPHKTVLLVDTYDTLKSGIPNAIAVFKKMEYKGLLGLKAIRLDSGDLDYLSKRAREMLDLSGLLDVKIVVSSDLDEQIIEHLKQRKAPIDIWGVGTRLITGFRDPYLPGVYKIVAKSCDNGYVPCIKISNQLEKMSNPGIKNVLRFYDENDQMLADLICFESELSLLEEMIKEHKPIRFNHPSQPYSHFILENYAGKELLLEKVMMEGKKIHEPVSLNVIKDYRACQLTSLDYTYRRLLNPHLYKVSLSSDLKKCKDELMAKIR